MMKSNSRYLRNRIRGFALRAIGLGGRDRRAGGRVAAVLSVGVLISFAHASIADTLTEPLVSFETSTAHDSGWIENATDETVVLWNQRVSVPSASWLRIVFDDVQLGRTIGGRSGAHLRITSVLDGAVQTMHAEHILQWRGTSAYFNGEAVDVEIVARPNSGPCRVSIDRSIAGAPSAGAPRNLCGDGDDRVLSDDPRSARILPVGCTGWLIDDGNRCFLTAGHCVASGQADVMEFNVPLSMPSGSIIHPPPVDQYAVDAASIQNQIGQLEIGNDWAYLGTFPNSTSGLTAFESQGEYFVLADTVPEPTGQTLRKTGFGSTMSPVPGEWDQAQKTMAGPFAQKTGTILRFTIDSSGGDSGSPVFVDGSDVAYAVHTNGGCDSPTDTNSGTSVEHLDLRAALEAPTGICVPDYFDFSYPDGRPQLVHIDGTTTLRVDVTPRNLYDVAVDSGLLHVDDGDGWQTTSFQSVGGSTFEATFPAVSCLRTIRYYVSFETTTGGMSADPLNAPDVTYHSLSGSELVVLASYDFESTTGWFVTNQSVTAGAWVAGMPVGMGLFGTPIADFDGSGSCYLTGNASAEEDIDGGPTRLWSPAIDMSQAENPTIRFAQWFTNSNLDEDRLSVELSNNSAVNFTEVASYAHHEEWREESIFVKSTFPTPGSIRVRFVATDNPNNSRTEAAIDSVVFMDVRCDVTCTKGDLDSNGVVDGSDIGHFVSAMLDPPPPESNEFCAADMNSDLALTIVGDLASFVDCVLGNSCP